MHTINKMSKYRIECHKELEGVFFMKKRMLNRLILAITCVLLIIFTFLLFQSIKRDDELQNIVYTNENYKSSDNNTYSYEIPHTITEQDGFDISKIYLNTDGSCSQIRFMITSTNPFIRSGGIIGDLQVQISDELGNSIVDRAMVFSKDFLCREGVVITVDVTDLVDYCDNKPYFPIIEMEFSGKAEFSDKKLSIKTMNNP